MLGAVITPDKAQMTNLRRLMKILPKKDLRNAFVECQVIALRSIAQNFEQDGRPAWQDLQPATIDRKGSAAILQDKGILKGSIFPTSPNTATRITHSTLFVGTTMVYAATHQFGDPDRGIPARPFLVWQDEDVASFEEVFLKYLGRE